MWLPGTGPRVARVEKAGEPQEANFVLLPISDVQVGLQEDRRSTAPQGRFFNLGGVVPQKVRIGDVLNVTIFEASQGGLFAARIQTQEGPTATAGSTSIPSQVVDQQGMIFIPYAGWVHVADKSVPEVSAAIGRSLSGVAVEPQVFVTVGNARGNTVSVLGNVANRGRFPLSPAGDRILDIVAQAGGVTSNPRDTSIRLVRGRQTFEVPLSIIIGEPDQNIIIHPNDTISVETLRHTYSVLGGTNAQNEFAIDRDRLTLAEAIGRAGGLNDNRANKKGLFIFRYESAGYLGRFTDVDRFAGLDPIPVVYQLRVSDPRSYHLMQRFVVLNDDIIYVANAPATDFAKFLGILNSSVSSVSAPLLIGATVAAN